MKFIASARVKFTRNFFKFAYAVDVHEFAGFRVETLEVATGTGKAIPADHDAFKAAIARAFYEV